MKTHPKRHVSVGLPLTVLALLILALAFAGGALAESGDMSGMPGMTDEEMQNMATPTPSPSATAMSNAGSQGVMPATSSADGHGSKAGMDPTMDMGGGSANWLVIGGFAALIAGSTIAAVATKRHLRRRMLAGELADAGVQDV